ncbi:MAG: hypothetical protein IT477_10790 [Rhodanobacteraceae bacterium]|nr:hypothetical protein [Rhodanobacteraceae bacterium]
MTPQARPLPPIGAKVRLPDGWVDGTHGISGIAATDIGTVVRHLAGGIVVDVQWPPNATYPYGGIKFLHRWGYDGIYDLALAEEPPRTPEYVDKYGWAVKLRAEGRLIEAGLAPDETGPSASVGEDMVPAAVLARRASVPRKIVVPTEGFWDMEHLLPDAEPEGIVKRKG